MNKMRPIIVLMLFAASAALILFANVDRKVMSTRVDLSAIPRDFGEWRMVSESTTVGKTEATFLDDVIIRAYQRKDGRQVMLAVAFGADQRKKYTIHLPEVCYASAGFSVTTIGQAVLDTPNLRLKQLLVKDATTRRESVQYWIVLNNRVVTDDFDRKLKQAFYTFFGAEAGGVLVRISSPSGTGDIKHDYEVQKEFIAALHGALNKELQTLLFGNESKP